MNPPEGCGDQPVLTVLTPCLNAVDTLEDTLSSVSRVAQELHGRGLTLEHWLIDGGSQDGTLDLIERYQKRHRFCQSLTGVTGGPYAAMNLGLSFASGQFTHILNADDLIWDVSAYLQLIERGLTCQAYFLMGSIVYFRRPGYRVCSCWRVQALPDSRNRWKRQIRRGLHYPHPGFIARTELYRRQGFDPRYSLSADYKLMQELLLGSSNSDVVCVSEKPIVAMAEGGATGQWRAIVSGYYQLREINKDLGIYAPAWRRYLAKIVMRYLGIPFYWIRLKGRQG